VFPSGNLAEGISIRVRGHSYHLSSFEVEGKSDHHGRFSVDVPGNSYCLVLASSREMAAPMGKIVVRHEQPSQPLSFTLQPLTRVTFKTGEADRDPFGENAVTIHQDDGMQGKYFKSLSADRRLAKEPRHGDLFFRQNIYFKQKGLQGIKLGPGHFEVQRVSGRKALRFSIESETQLNLDLRELSTDKHLLRGQIVAAPGTSCSVENAQVHGIARILHSDNTTVFQSFQAIGDQQGHFAVSLPEHPFVVTVTSADESCRGVAIVPANAQKVVLVLEPAVTVSGTLLRWDGTPVAGRRVTAAIQHSFQGKFQPDSDKQKVTTDAQGKFKFTGLIAAQSYQVRVPGKRLPGEAGTSPAQTFSFRTVVNNANQSLGDVKLPTPSDDAVAATNPSAD